MECPRCGFEQPSGDECGGCGIVFAKFFAAQSRALQTLEPAAAPQPALQGPPGARSVARATVAYGSALPPTAALPTRPGPATAVRPSPTVPAAAGVQGAAPGGAHSVYRNTPPGGWPTAPSPTSPEVWGAAPTAPSPASPEVWGAAPTAPPPPSPASEAPSWATAFDAPGLPSDQGPSAWPGSPAVQPSAWGSGDPSGDAPSDAGPTAWAPKPSSGAHAALTAGRPERSGLNRRAAPTAASKAPSRGAVAGLVLGTLGLGVGVAYLVDPSLFKGGDAAPAAPAEANTDAPAPAEGRLPDTPLGRFTGATLEFTDGLARLMELEGEAGYDYWERLEGQVGFKRLETLYLAMPENDKLRAYELWQVLKTLGPDLTKHLEKYKRPSGDGYAFTMPAAERSPLRAERLKLREAAQRLEERIQVF